MFPHNPDLFKALIPDAEVRQLMRSGGEDVPATLKRDLTLIHEAGHAIVAEALRGFICEFVDVDPRAPRVNTPKVGEVPDGNEDLVDLAGLYAELRCGGELAYSHAHLQNATDDLDKARSRLARGEPEIRWARKFRPLAQELVGYLWVPISKVAAALVESERLERAEVVALFHAHNPRTTTPPSLRARLKPEHVVQ